MRAYAIEPKLLSSSSSPSGSRSSVLSSRNAARPGGPGGNAAAGDDVSIHQLYVGAGVSPADPVSSLTYTSGGPPAFPQDGAQSMRWCRFVLSLIFGACLASAAASADS